MAQVKWGVIGAGGIAMRRTLPGAMEGAKSAAFMAVMDVRQEAAAARFGVPTVCARASRRPSPSTAWASHRCCASA